MQQSAVTVKGWTDIPPVVLGRREHDDGMPSITYRSAGDRFLQVEYGPMEFDLTLNFYVHSVEAKLKEVGLDGLVETSPGFRSMLVSYDAATVKPADLVRELDAVHDDLPGVEGLVLPSRLFRLPACFDDSQSRQAVERYARSIRPDAPNCVNDNNIDYTLQYNGLQDLDELVEHVTATDLWTGFIGFFPGLPFMFPVDPRHVLFAPKYNPTRTWTAEGAIGLGGPCYSIYPVESPGGYQLIGRTLPIFDPQQRNPIFADDPIMVKPGDRIRFHPVSEDELLDTFARVHTGEYEYQVEDGTLDVAAHLAWSAQHREEAEEWARVRDSAAAATEVP